MWAVNQWNCTLLRALARYSKIIECAEFLFQTNHFIRPSEHAIHGINETTFNIGDCFNKCVHYFPQEMKPQRSMFAVNTSVSVLITCLAESFNTKDMWEKVRLRFDWKYFYFCADGRNEYIRMTMVCECVQMFHLKSISILTNIAVVVVFWSRLEIGCEE